MGQPFLEIKGIRYLTSGQAAILLGINQRTLLRWVKRSGEPGSAAILKQIVSMRDPISGFNYFREDSILDLRAQLLQTRPMS